MFDEPGFPREADADDPLLPLLYHFVYCSRASDGVDEAEVGRIVESAKRHNAALGITGVLTFGSGIFFQWIEGPRAVIEKLIANLHGDSRHYDIVSLSQSEERRERLYPQWDMERVSTDDIREVLQEALETTEDESSVAALNRTLKHLDSQQSQASSSGH